jgi:tetratricopeptide (TPR) repeat protein
MKKLFLVLFLTLPNKFMFSQNKLNIDSLLTVYKNQPLDTIKIRTVNHIINYYMYRSQAETKKYALEQLNMSKKCDFKSGLALANYHLGNLYHNISQLDSAKYYYEKSLFLGNQLENHIYISQAYRGLAIIEFDKGNLQKADSINNMDLENAIKFKDSMGMGLAYDFKGTINQNMSYYNIALTNVQKGLKIFEKLKDSIRIADTYNHLGTLEYNLENLEKAIQYNEIALKIYQDYNDIGYEAQVLNDIGIYYMKLKNYDNSLDYLSKSLEKTRQSQFKGIETAALNNLGNLYFLNGDLNNAIKYLNQSITLGKSINAKRRIAVAENKLSEVYLSNNDLENALKNAISAKKYSEDNNSLSINMNSTSHLSNIYEKKGDLKLALKYQREFKKLNDSIINKDKINKIQELRIQFDTEKKEAEIALQNEEIKSLNIQAKNDRLTKTLYGLGFFSMLVIASSIYFGFKQRMKKNKIEREKQEEIYKQEIEFKKKELASQTLHLVQKNTFIQELKDNLEKIKQSPELFKIEFRRLVMLLKKESAEDKDWEVFKSYFTEVHNNFDIKIKEIYADISEKEIRLASFLRMNLSTKEIASMLNVLPDSVLKSKYRLKKKLELPKEADLNTFLFNL